MTDRKATSATLVATAKASKPGDRILVAGLIDIAMLNGMTFAAPGVIIEGDADTRWTSASNGYQLSDAEGITFRNGAIAPYPSGAMIIYGRGCSRIVFDTVEYSGLPTGAVEGGPGGAVSLGGTLHRNCHFHDLQGGVSLRGGFGHHFENCVFERCYNDAITGVPDGDVRIVNCRFSSFTGPALHLDAIQIYTRDRTIDRVVIEGNLFDRGDGSPMQGIFMVNEGRQMPGFRNVSIQNNGFFGPAWHGISVIGEAAAPSCENAVVAGNFVQGLKEPYLAPGDNRRQVIERPWIRVSAAGPRVTVKNNAGTSVEVYRQIDGGGNTTIPPAANRNDRARWNEWLKARDSTPVLPLARQGSGGAASELLASAATAHAALGVELGRRSALAAIGLQLAQAARSLKI